MNGFNFTERVRKCLSLAREESVRLKHEYVGTEHILLGLIAEGEGVAAAVMTNLHVDLEQMRDTVDATVKRGRATTTGPDLPYTSRAKKVLELAMREARDMDHDYVGTEHLLLGLLAEERGIAAQILVDAGVTLENARVETLRILGTEIPPDMQPSRARPRSLWTSPLPRVTARLKGVLSQARELAPSPDGVTPVMIAVALLRQSEGAMRAVLEYLDLDIDRLLDALVPVMEKEIADAEGANPNEREEVVRRLVLTANSERDASDELCSTAHVLVALVLTVPAVAEAFLAQGVKPEDVRKAFSRLSG